MQISISLRDNVSALREEPRRSSAYSTCRTASRASSQVSVWKPKAHSSRWSSAFEQCSAPRVSERLPLCWHRRAEKLLLFSRVCVVGLQIGVWLGFLVEPFRMVKEMPVIFFRQNIFWLLVLSLGFCGLYFVPDATRYKLGNFPHSIS